MADIYVDEVGSLDPASKTVKQTQRGFEAVYNPMNYPLPGDRRKSFGIGQTFAVVLAVASLAVPGIGEIIGASILEAAGITGASAAVTSGVGAAALSAANTALQGGSVEDVLKSAASAGVASGLNVGMGGGVTGAVTGSTAGTIIKGGDASQVITNAFAAGVGAGVQGAMTKNPDAGKILGTAARTYIATGGKMDQTLLNTAAAAIGTLDQPAKTAQQLQAASSPSGNSTAQETFTETQPASDAQTAEPITVSETPIKLGDTYYYPMSNGGAAYTDDKGVNRYISASEFEADKSTFGVSYPSNVVPPADVATKTLDPQTIVANSPNDFPLVTDLDLVKKVGAQPTPTVDPKELERVIVQGQGSNVANVAPVSTEITTPQQLERVVVEGKYDQLPEPGFEEYQPLPPKLEDVTVQGYSDKSEVVTDVNPEDPKKEEPEKEKPDEEKEEPKNLYPTVTTVSRPTPPRPRALSTITGTNTSRLLADALAAYRPAGAIEGEESGKERQNVWNEKSLRLKDALGL